jgi:uncharacterized membrane protein YoaK (UPF0700 family)
LGRALIAGYVDSFSLLTLGVYASFMSGNTTSAGLHIGQTSLVKAAHSLLPIPFFVLGIVLGTFVLQMNQDLGLTRVSLLVSAFLAFGIVALQFSWPKWLSVTVLSTAMGAMNTTITHVGHQRVSLGYVTGDLSSLGKHLVGGIKRDAVQDAEGPWDTHWRRAALLSAIWFSFFLGAAIGAEMAFRIAVWALLVPIIVLLVSVIAHRANPFRRDHRDVGSSER